MGHFIFLTNPQLCDSLFEISGDTKIYNLTDFFSVYISGAKMSLDFETIGGLAFFSPFWDGTQTTWSFWLFFFF